MICIKNAKRLLSLCVRVCVRVRCVCVCAYGSRVAAFIAAFTAPPTTAAPPSFLTTCAFCRRKSDRVAAVMAVPSISISAIATLAGTSPYE